MITRRFVKERALQRLNSKQEIPKEVLDAVRTGDKFRNMVDQLTNELQKAARIVNIRRGHPLKLSTIQMTIDDFTDVLINSVEKEGIRRTESDLDRLQREKQIQEHEDLENTIAGNPSGVYEELGVEIVEDRDESESSEET